MKLTDAAAAGLKRRYLAQAAAERDLASFLEGVVTALGIDPASVTGFDDASGELLLREDAEEGVVTYSMPPVTNEDDRDDVT